MRGGERVHPVGTDDRLSPVRAKARETASTPPPERAGRSRDRASSGGHPHDGHQRALYQSEAGDLTVIARRHYGVRLPGTLRRRRVRLQEIAMTKVVDDWFDLPR